MIKWIIFILFNFFLLIAHAQNSVRDSSRVFTPIELREDWRIFRKALTEAHPAVYRYTSKEELNQFFDSVNASFTNPLSETEFVKLLMLGVAKIRCVHTNAGFSEGYYKIVPITKNTILPLNFKYINGEAYIKRNSSRDSITNIIGLKVNSINGRTMNSYKEEIYPLLNGDGYIQTSRYEQLGNDFNDFYNYFIGRPDTFFLDCVNPQTKEKVELKVAAISIQELITRYKWRNRNLDILSYKVLNGNVAYIQINSFFLPYLRKKKQAPYKFLKIAFKDIRKRNIQDVIIDIRNNGGGHGEYGAKLFSYLRDSSFRSDQSQVVKAIKFDQDYMQYGAKHQLKSIQPSNVTKTDSGVYAVKNRLTGLLKPWEPAKRPFTGNAYLLISGSTYSAASHFATTFNAYNRGPIIGQETGGQSYGPNGFWRINIVLPNTKARINIPLVSTHHYSKSFTHGRGIMPTHEIDNKERVKALIYGRDPELDYALKLISNKQLIR